MVTIVTITNYSNSRYIIQGLGLMSLLGICWTHHQTSPICWNLYPHFGWVWFETLGHLPTQGHSDVLLGYIEKAYQPKKKTYGKKIKCHIWVAWENQPEKNGLWATTCDFSRTCDTFAGHLRGLKRPSNHPFIDWNRLTFDIAHILVYVTCGNHRRWCCKKKTKCCEKNEQAIFETSKKMGLQEFGTAMSRFRKDEDGGKSHEIPACFANMVGKSAWRMYKYVKMVSSKHGFRCCFCFLIQFSDCPPSSILLEFVGHFGISGFPYMGLPRNGSYWKILSKWMINRGLS